jgi:DNA-binding IclR family transcriptional regulator
MSKIVGRTLDLMELFAKEKRPLALTDIAHLLKIPMSSCHDVVRTMRARGYLYQIAPRAGYYPTSRLHSLGKEIGESDPVVLRAEPLLRPLRDTLDETVLLAKANGLDAIVLLVLEPAHPLHVRRKVGEHIDRLYATSAGKALLGGLQEPEFSKTLKLLKLDALTKHTITTIATLRKDVELGRKNGWYLNHEESLDRVSTSPRLQVRHPVWMRSSSAQAGC